MKLKKLSLFFLALSCGCVSIAQTSQQKKLLPMLAPPSPEAASLGRYGTYEVNLFSGVPNISIPIYDIQVGELKLPINIKYHASGIKVSETPSRVGLGWSLNAGGTITRKIQGKPDEQPNNYFSATSTSEFRVKNANEIDGASEAGLDYLSKVDVRTYDGEPDIFSYNFPGHSGRFLFNQKDNFKPFLIPYAPVQVSKTYVDAITVNFALKDDGGRKYAFNTVETTTTGSGVGLNSNTSSAWLLSDIISANTQDTIRLKYSSEEIADQYENEYLVINDNATANGGQGYYTNDLGTFGGEIVNVGTTSKRLDSIIFLNGKIIFEPGTDGRRIKFIKVYSYESDSKSYSLLKIIQFFHSYFINDNTSRLRLDSLQVQTFNNTPIQTYRFVYNTNVALPNKLSKQKDYWGYFNNRVNNIPNSTTPTSIPKTAHTYSAPPGSPYTIYIGGENQNARDPDPNYMQAYILQQITFPTGGYTQFEYETNQYLDNGNQKYAGGLRIKSIKSYTAASTTPNIKTYKYGANESGYGRSNFVLAQHFFANHQDCRWVEIGMNEVGECRMPISYKTMHTYFANPTNDIEGADGSPVVYPVVTEYEGDSLTNNGKTIYQYTDKPDAVTSIIGYGKPYYDSYHFIRGFLSNKSVYKNNSSYGYSIVYEERKKYQYAYYQWSTGGIGIVVKKITIDQGNTGTIDNIGTNYGTSCQFFSDAYNYNYNNYNIVSGDNKLVSDTIITYDQNDPSKYVVSATNYTYDDLTHLNVSQVQTTNSKLENVKTTYTYPYNYTSAPYNFMDAAHIWDKTVIETKFNGTAQLTQQTTNYNSFSGNNYLPANIAIQVKSNTPETRAAFNSYDARGNILEMQKTSDAKQSFIWDYKSLHLVAEVSGAAQSEIAYTSFEGDGNGGWNGVTGQGFANNGSITGKSAYTQNSFSFSKPALNSSASYTISYWSKNGVYSVNGSSGTSLKTFNGWTLYQHTINNPAGGTITVSGSGTIDELRLYPSGAQMKTYTYEPLIGVSSVCDINNRISYYYYDGFSRLILVKDDANNIIKQQCYNYLGQSEVCTIYSNTVQQNSFTKNNCSSGTGTAVNYVVPANIYYASTQADANALALNEVNAAGQAYANANGSCTAPQTTVNGQSYIGSPYIVNFYNTATGQSYSMWLYPYNTGSVTLPIGTYDVSFYPYSGSEYTYFNINGYSTYGYNANFSSVYIGTGSSAYIGY